MRANINPTSFLFSQFVQCLRMFSSSFASDFDFDKGICAFSKTKSTFQNQIAESRNQRKMPTEMGLRVFLLQMLLVKARKQVRLNRTGNGFPCGSSFPCGSGTLCFQCFVFGTKPMSTRRNSEKKKEEQRNRLM